MGPYRMGVSWRGIRKPGLYKKYKKSGCKCSDILGIKNPTPPERTARYVVKNVIYTNRKKLAAAKGPLHKNYNVKQHRNYHMFIYIYIYIPDCNHECHKAHAEVWKLYDHLLHVVLECKPVCQSVHVYKYPI